MSIEPASRGSGDSTLGRRALGSLRVASAVLEARWLAHASADTIRRAQERRIARMVAHAARTVPHYRDVLRSMGLDPAAIRSAADLARLPLIERTQLQQEPDRFLSSAWPRSEYLELRSGGSSGLPRSVYHHPISVLENTGQGEREQARLRALTGKRRFRTLSIASPRGAEADLRAFARRHAFIPDHALPERRRCSMAERPEDVAREIAASRPDVVRGFGSYLEQVAQALAEQHGRSAAPRVFAYGGDGMSTAGRSRIRERLGAAVWSFYQAIECLKIASECPAGSGLHVHSDLCVVRVVDAAGLDVPTGRRGEVVIANLVNPATVLLNYRLGDEAMLLAGPCGCGSAQPLLSFPEGRVEDWFQVSSGERVYTQRLRALFTDERDVWQYQIVQESPSSLRVAVVAAGGADLAALSARIEGALTKVVGAETALTVDFVDELERTAHGKVRAVIRRGDAAQPATPTA